MYAWSAAPVSAGAVAVNDPVLERTDLLEHRIVAGDDARVVHDFREAQHPGVGLQREQVVPVQHRAVGRQAGGRDAGRGHDVHAERTELGALEHEADALEAEHVGDLVRDP